jgi:pimeloyl-ACP methyl ester carboxylesterase
MSHSIPSHTEPSLETFSVNGIRMRVAQQGAGPLVLLCHGWPESWNSWRHQLAALAAAGYRAVAPDMRGYGGTEAPPDVESYTQLHLVGDMVDLVKVLGETTGARRWRGMRRCFGRTSFARWWA